MYESANNNRIHDVGGALVSYDAAGNMTQDGTGVGTHTYQWDAEGLLKSVNSPNHIEPCPTGAIACYK